MLNYIIMLLGGMIFAKGAHGAVNAKTVPPKKSVEKEKPVPVDIEPGKIEKKLDKDENPLDTLDNDQPE